MSENELYHLSRIKILYSSELYHHGIKGMKWGVRRYQNPDGTLTKAGERRYKKQEKKEKIRAEMKQNFINSGLTEEEAELETNGRLMTEKILKGVAITAAAGTAAVIGWHLYNKYRGEMDSVINSGTILQRIEMQDTDQLHDTFYAAVNKYDKKRYLTRLPGERAQKGLDSWKLDIESKKKQKIAGHKNAKKIFDNLVKTDSEFAKYAKEFGSGDYESFNKAFTVAQSLGAKNRMKFLDALRKAGYGGFKDLNDMRVWGFDSSSSYDAKNPVILMNNGLDYVVKSKQKLDSGFDAMHRVFEDSIKREKNKETISYLETYMPMYGAMSLGLLGIAKYQDKKGDYTPQVANIRELQARQEAYEKQRKQSERK